MSLLRVTQYAEEIASYLTIKICFGIAPLGVHQ